MRPIVGERAHGRRIDDRFRALLAASPADLAASYCRRRPATSRTALEYVLSKGSGRFALAGADIMVVQENGFRRPLVIEVNAAPGFAYCTPGLDAWEAAYRRTADLVVGRVAEADYGGLALLTESKIPVETVGFQAALTERAGTVVPVLGPDALRSAQQLPEDGAVRVLVGDQALTGGLRYLHRRPWELLPPNAAGSFVNGTDVDLNGGRDKAAAHLAISAFNARNAANGIVVDTPHTEVVRDEAALQEAMGQLEPSWAVLKTRHGNSGDGVYFVPPERDYQPCIGFPFVVQETLLPRPLSRSPRALLPLTHNGKSYVYDLRVVVGSFPTGLAPLMVYARRATASTDDVSGTSHSRSVDLGAILKVNIAVGDTTQGAVLEEERLVLPDTEGWESLGLTEDDYVDAIVQSMLATVAVAQGAPLSEVGTQ